MWSFGGLVTRVSRHWERFGQRWSYGHSVVYDPWGQMVACASDREEVVLADIDIELVHEVRKRMPCQEHRRL